MNHRTRSLNWKLRRIAAGLRQQDVASQVGISTTRYSAYERGELKPSALDAQLIESTLPQFPSQIVADPAQRAPDR